MNASIHVYETHREAATAAAKAVADETRRLIAERGRAVVVFSGAPEQAELLDHLATADSIEWTRVIGFHTFELLGADETAAHSQRKFLLDHLVSRVPMAEFHGLRGEAANPEAVCRNYAELMKSRPPDFAVLEIKANGELAAIDSIHCDLNDLSAVKVTNSAITLTISTLMACPCLFVVAESQAANEGGISMHNPAAILLSHPNAHLFLKR